MLFSRKRRFAFVVGVRDYDNFRKLKLSGHDAWEIARQFDRLGFDVTTCLDAKDGTTHAKLQAAWEDFLVRADGAEMAVFYFAGHGVQENDENYLLARDAALLDSDEEFRGILFRKAFERLCKKTDTTIAILDACREQGPAVPPGTSTKLPKPDPVAAAPAAGDERRAQFDIVSPSIEQSRLVDASEFGRDNRALIAYAALPRNPAHEGPGPLSYFTQAIVDQIDVPGLPIDALFKTVCDEVRAATNPDTVGHGLQTPDFSSHLGNERAFFRKPTWRPFFGLFGLSLVAALVALAFSKVEPLAPLQFGSQPVFVGIAFALIAAFSLWQWGGERARPLLIGCTSLIVWSVVAFFFDAVTSHFGLLGPQVSAAAALSLILGALLFMEVRAVSFAFLALPGMVLVLAILLSMSPIFQDQSKFVLENYYTLGFWLVGLGAGIGLCFSMKPNPSSNWQRRLLWPSRSRIKVGRAAVAGAILGAVAGLSGPPTRLVGDSTPTTWVPQQVADFVNATMTIYSGAVAINCVPGLALAVCFASIMSDTDPDERGDQHHNSALFAFFGGLGLWVMVAWLIPYLGKSELPLPSAFVYIVVAVVLAIGLLSYSAMLAPRLWRVPIWLLGTLFSLAGLIFFVAMRWLLPADLYRQIRPGAYALLYAPWLCLFMGTIAYGLTAEDPSQYGTFPKETNP